NGLTTPAAPVTITVNMSNGLYSDVFAAPPAGVTVVLIGNGSLTTIVGHSPALTVASGKVIAEGITLTTDTPSSSILVAGGSLLLRDDIIEESPGYSASAITITGGSMDLGTADSPGLNIFNVNGTGQFFDNTTSTPVSAFGDTFTVNGLPLELSSLS